MGETKLLELTWNKVDDKIAVQFQKCEIPTPIRHKVLSNVARIYDPLGMVFPTSLTSKLLYREICDRKILWDKKLPPDLVAKWSEWQDELPDKVEIPRSLVSNQEVQYNTIQYNTIQYNNLMNTPQGGFSVIIYNK